MNELSKIQIDALKAKDICNLTDIDDVLVASYDLGYHYLNYLLKDNNFIIEYLRYVNNEKQQ